MTQWDYVIAVYIVSIAGTAGLIGWCYASLRRTEKRLEEVKRK